MKSHNYYVYIMSGINKVLYVGVSNNLIKRVEEHKEEVFKGFTKKYKCKKLVYYEWFTDINVAIRREKQLKNWRREKKVFLIEKDNKEWRDLYNDLLG